MTAVRRIAATVALTSALTGAAALANVSSASATTTPKDGCTKAASYVTVRANGVSAEIALRMVTRTKKGISTSVITGGFDRNLRSTTRHTHTVSFVDALRLDKGSALAKTPVTVKAGSRALQSDPRQAAVSVTGYVGDTVQTVVTMTGHTYLGRALVIGASKTKC